MGSTLYLGLRGGVHLAPPGMLGLGKDLPIKDFSVEELHTLVEFGTTATLLINTLPSIYNQLMDRTLGGAQFLAVAREAPGLTDEQRIQVRELGRVVAEAVNKVIPKVRKDIPAMFRQLDQMADLLAQKSGHRVLFYGPVYYADEMRTSVLDAERRPAGAHRGVYDFRPLARQTSAQLVKRYTEMFSRARSVLEKLDPSLKGAVPDLPRTADEIRVALGAVPLMIPAFKALLPVLAKYINLTVVIATAISSIILAALVFSVIAMLLYVAAAVVAPLLPAAKEAVGAIFPPLASGVQWIMIFVGLGLGIGMIFAGPTLIHRLEAMFAGTAWEARGRGREIQPPGRMDLPERVPVSF